MHLIKKNSYQQTTSINFRVSAVIILHIRIISCDVGIVFLSSDRLNMKVTPLQYLIYRVKDCERFSSHFHVFALVATLKKDVIPCLPHDISILRSTFAYRMDSITCKQYVCDREMICRFSAETYLPGMYVNGISQFKEIHRIITAGRNIAFLLHFLLCWYLLPLFSK